MALTPETWREVLRLHAAASALPADERDAFLVRECRDPAVLSAVRRMLAAPPGPEFLEPPRPSELAAGRSLGDFTLLEEIGRGGMGVVYRALQRPLQRIVAVKLLPGSFALTPRQVDRFEREARAAARLSHPNLVAVLTVGEEGGVRYFAMEYVEGHNLADELKRLRADLTTDEGDSAHLPSSHASEYFRSIAECIRQAADGLAHAHEHGVVHRDVKPSNLLLDRNGRIKLVDFGLARDEEQGSLSASGDILGTPHYMSPEQARAHRHQIDHRTDIYSLGVVMYELLTLQRPFEGKTSQEVIEKLLHREPVAIRRLNHRVPRDLAIVCGKAMARDPRDRYATAAELRDDLQRFLSHVAIVARSPSLLQRSSGLVRRHRLALAACLVAAAALATGLGLAAQLAESRRRAELLDVIVSTRAEGPLRGLPLARLLELRRALAEWNAETHVSAAEAGDQVNAARRELDELRLELLERGRASLLRSRDAARSEGTREMERLGGLLTLLQAAHLFPEDEQLRSVARVEASFPTIAVRAFDAAGGETGADVFLREIDFRTSAVGLRRALGRAPLEPMPIQPGYYRVVVLFDDGGHRELVCSPGPAEMEIVLEARRRSDEARIVEDMLLLAGGTYTYPGSAPTLSGASVDLADFWIDATEVRNSDYQRFLEATGAPAPEAWTLAGERGEFLRAHGELPVTGISWKEAVAYAQWAGKRLPSVTEWARAAGGFEGRRLPHSTDPGATPLGNVQRPYVQPSSPAEAWLAYLELAAPVRSSPEARTPEGLHHMYGNAAEWSESMAATPEAGDQLRPRLYDRFVCGQAWDALALGQSMLAPAYSGIGPHYENWRTGFRCAKSAAP